MSKLSVIIPTLNEERHVGALLSDVASQARKPDEVLVVDGGSTDGTVAIVRRFPAVRLLTQTPPAPWRAGGTWVAGAREGTF